jgi:hypothetical protein
VARARAKHTQHTHTHTHTHTHARTHAQHNLPPLKVVEETHGFYNALKSGRRPNDEELSLI